MAKTVTFVVSLLLAGFLGVVLVRTAPGFGVDERELDPRLSRESIEQIRSHSLSRDTLLVSYLKYIGRLAQGDFGTSQSLGQPVRELLRDRLPVTAASVGLALASVWLATVLLVAPPLLFHLPGYDLVVAGCSGFLLCVPATVAALLCLYYDVGPAPAIAAAVFPRVFRFVRNVLGDVARRPHLLAARARGVGRWGLFFRHILTPSAPQWITLMGLSITAGLTAAIPAEALCGSAGIGQLAWTAALARDLPLLVTLTILVAAVTLTANLASELVAGRPLRERV
jgi:peptide/nickel transport system permease protein